MPEPRIVDEALAESDKSGMWHPQQEPRCHTSTETKSQAAPSTVSVDSGMAILQKNKNKKNS